MFRTSTDVMKMKIQDLPTFYSVFPSTLLCLAILGHRGQGGEVVGGVPGGTEYELRVQQRK